MEREPIICLISGQATGVEDVLRRRYVEGYRIIVGAPQADTLDSLRGFREQDEQFALFVYEEISPGIDFFKQINRLFPEARKLLLSNQVRSEAELAIVDHAITSQWIPPETRLYPLLDELLAEWRASVEMSFTHVSGIMTVRAVRIRIGDSLHRAAELIALSNISDLMVIDNDNNFIGVLSVGDVLRAAMPDIEEIMEEGGTLDQAFRLFLRKGSELMYQPIEPLIITNPLVVAPDDHVAKAAALMLEKNIHRLPVVKDGRLVGTVGRADICQAVVGTL